jgi:hypothetical protein
MASPSVGMRQVGEFMQPRQMIRSVRNPMDKATIVSIYPKDIRDSKETIQPGKFHVPGGNMDKPSITVVGASSWWNDRDADLPLLEIPVSAVQIAESIIVDYCNGFLAASIGDAMPGLFYIAGELSLEDVKRKYSVELVNAKFRQDKWYNILVKLGDSLWARSNGNPLAIWDEMRLAARELGRDKPWLKDFQAKEMVRCFACGALRDPDFPICSNCKNVDMEHPRAKDIRIAQMG